MTDEEREALIIEYKHLHNENWYRGQNIWLVNSILITGSLIASFSTGTPSSIGTFVSLVLVLMAFIWTRLSEMITIQTYKQMEKIRKRLGMHESEKLHDILRRQLWFRFKKWLIYLFLALLIVVYSYLLAQSFQVV